MTREAILACEYPFTSRFLDADTRKTITELVKEGKMVRLDLQNPKRIRYERSEAAAKRDAYRATAAAELEAKRVAEAAKHLPIEVSYRIQNQDHHSDRWFNDALFTDHELASQSLAQAREHYSATTWRLLLITTATEVIA